MENTPLTAHVESLGATGDGVVRINDAKVFVPNALPGETVTFAKPNGPGKVTVFNADRAVPPCPHFGACGGCVAQHMTAALYQDWKQATARTTITREIPEPTSWHNPVFVPDHTRRRVTLAAFRTSKTNFSLGFHARRDTAVIDIATCVIMHPDLLRFILAAKPHLAALLPFQKAADIQVQMVENGFDVLVTGPVGPKGRPDMDVHHAVMDLAQAMPDLARIAWRARDRDAPEILLAPRVPLVQFEGLTIALPVGAFLQPSQAGEIALRQAIAQAVATHAATASKALDLFCGCGTLTPALLSVPYVQAYDSDHGVIAALQGASKSIPRLHVDRRDLFRQPMSAKELSAFDIVLMDPARAGALDQCANLAKSTVGLIIYVSCNPATFARDAAALIQGGYTFANAQLIDQFTYSAHTEVVGIFARGTKK
ncbi:MAG: hypothetical protein V4621_06340 [Pseudomonadota bacterium]